MEESFAYLMNRALRSQPPRTMVLEDTEEIRFPESSVHLITPKIGCHCEDQDEESNK